FHKIYIRFLTISSGSILSCTIHKCPRRCHRLADHSKMKCDVVMSTMCPRDHEKKWKCFEVMPLTCRVCDREDKLRQEQQERDFERQKRIEAETKSHFAAMEKLQAELYEARQDLQEKQLSTQRTAAILHKMK